MEYREAVDNSNFVFQSQLASTSSYLKERAAAAFEYHTQLIDENINGGVAEFDTIIAAFSSELDTLIVNAEKILQKTHDRLFEKIFAIIKASTSTAFNAHEDFTLQCRAAFESEGWETDRKKLQKTLSNYRSEKRCKMLAEYLSSNRAPEFVFTDRKTMAIHYRMSGLPRLVSVDESKSFRSYDITKRVLLKRIYDDGGATDILPVQYYSHRNILLCIGKEFHNGSMNLMFDHLPEVLSDLIEQEETIKLRDVRELLTGIQQALQYIHEQGAFHGDLCPENIFIDKDCCCSPPTPKIADIGICKTTNISGPPVIATDAWKEASPAYKSPEAHRGEARTLEQMQKCDIYSFGLLAWSIVTCKKVGDGLSEEQIQERIQEGSLLPILPSSGSSSLHSLLSACWSPQPERRPTAAELEEMIRMVAWPREGYEDSDWQEEARLWREAAEGKD